MKELSLSKYTGQAENLLGEAKDIFKDLKLSVDDLPDTMQPNDGAIKLVFVGQYSAGKSSIIKMLTGIETGIGAGITTQESHIYHWNGLEIIDTPGIQTGIRPDHDERAYEQINHAALLVFVVTNEGFDRQIGEHFRKLAIEQNRGGNMVLVINKMDRAPEGNSKDQQTIIRDDICKVLEPFTPEEFYLSFVSTQYYDEYITDEDKEWLEKSGREQLIENLNAFVSAKQLTAKIQQPVFNLDACVRQAIGTSDELARLEGTEDLLKRQHRIIDNVKADTEQEIRSLASTCQCSISSLGMQAASCLLEPGISQVEFENTIEGLRKRGDDEANRCINKINQAFRIMEDKIRSQLARELSSTYAKKIIQINNAFESAKLEVISHSEQDRINKVSSILKDGIEGLQKVGPGITKGMAEFLAGSSWKFWKVARYEAYIGKAFGAVGVAIPLIQRFYNEEKRKEQEKALQEAQSKINGEFKKCAEQIYENIIQHTSEQMKKIVDPELAKLQQAIDEIDKQCELQKRCAGRLEGLLIKIKNLQDDIEKVAAV